MCGAKLLAELGRTSQRSERDVLLLGEGRQVEGIYMYCIVL